VRPLDLRAAHPTDCTCDACDEEATRELATTFPGAVDRRRVVVAGRLARAIRSIRDAKRDDADEKKRSA
jgi:hypothetical protein